MSLSSSRNFFIRSQLYCKIHTRARVFNTNRAMDFQPSAGQQSKEFKEHESLNIDEISERIIPHLINLYGSRATAKDFEIYASEARFEDPLTCAHGVKQIKSAFYALPKLFSKSEIVEYTLKANSTAPGNVEVLIDNKQHYKIFGKDVDLASLIKLKMDQGKIVRHEDWWDKKPLKNRETVQLPLVGRLAEISRRGMMLLTHVLMGFGKDPKNHTE
ncbi:uncharacterized protein LOC110019882 [Phalaenopsis equestris]|uniref:uncharacterized protein LOC110019882 n=1 Tax=Phalaenopsis equestris TaxID=78828 RepID=UPI0009E1A252|nr:uncharacterized protein LOC110019882 [Phalaenopsis equestris]